MDGMEETNGVIFELDFDVRQGSERLPEEDLWIAVIYRAVLDLVQDNHISRGADRHEILRYTFMDVTENEVGSFNYVCEALGICNHTLRGRLAEVICDPTIRSEVSLRITHVALGLRGQRKILST